MGRTQIYNWFKWLKKVKVKVKVILTVFFDYRGIVHHEYAPKGQNITKEYYLEALRLLRGAVRRKTQDLLASRN